MAAIALCAAATAISAQSSMGFLNVNPDAASVALAGTSVGRAADAYSVEGNMAAAAQSASRLDAGAGFSLWQPNATKASVISVSGFGRLGKKLAIGASFKNFANQEYSLTSAEGRVSGTFTPKEMAVRLGASYLITEGLSAGVDVGFASSSIGEQAKASGVVFGVSAFYSKDALSAGLSVSNIGGKVSYGGASEYSLPTVARLGAAYALPFGLNLSAEADYVLSCGLMAGLGAEYWIKDIVALRAGYHYGSEQAIPSYASVGLGANIKGIKLNAAYLLASETLGGTMMFTLGYSF